MGVRGESYGVALECRQMNRFKFIHRAYARQCAGLIFIGKVNY